MTRADAGVPRMTRRDLAVLEWLEEMRVIYEPDLAELLGRLSGRDQRVSPTAVRTALRRWRSLDVAKSEKLFAHEPRLIWLTEKGSALVGSGVRYREPGTGILRHTALISRVRLWLEQRGLGGQPVVQWTSERQWRREHQAAVRGGAHVPDGIAVTPDGTEYAIEVEISDKGPSRTMTIAVQLTTAYQNVVYIVPGHSQTARTVRGALEEASRTYRRDGDGKVSIIEMEAAG